MYQFILLLHVFAAIFIIALVLVQQGKGSTMGSGFGGGASQTVFGSRGSGSFLFRLTMGIALAFFVTSLILNHLSTKNYKQQQQMVLPTLPIKPAPLTPAVPPVPAAVNPAVTTNPTANPVEKKSSDGVKPSADEKMLNQKAGNKEESKNKANKQDKAKQENKAGAADANEPVISADPGQPIMTMDPQKPQIEAIPVPAATPSGGRR